MSEQDRDVLRRFWVKVNVAGDDDCWEWAGSRSHGYGRFWMNGRLQPAHRVALELSDRPIPDGLVVDHLCRNPPCVNPAHLEAVTVGENSRRGLLGHGLGFCRNGHRIADVGWIQRGVHRRCIKCLRAQEGRTSRRYKTKRSECPDCGKTLTNGAMYNHRRDVHGRALVGLTVAGESDG